MFSNQNSSRRGLQESENEVDDFGNWNSGRRGLGKIENTVDDGGVVGARLRKFLGLPVSIPDNSIFNYSIDNPLSIE